jgi:hypothetical protein
LAFGQFCRRAFGGVRHQVVQLLHIGFHLLVPGSFRHGCSVAYGALFGIAKEKGNFI